MYKEALVKSTAIPPESISLTFFLLFVFFLILLIEDSGFQ